MLGARQLSWVWRAIEYGAAIWGVVAFIYYWDPTRTEIKRLTAGDPHRYEAIAPRYQNVPVDRLLSVRSHADAIAKRRRLIQAVWHDGSFPDSRLPDVVIPDIQEQADGPDCSLTGDEEIYFSPLECKIALYRRVENLSRISRLEIPVGARYRSVAALFVPKKGNGNAVLYHHGFAGTFHEQHRNLARLIEHGYTVIALNLPGYGDNIDRDRTGPFPKTGLEAARWVLEPVVVSLNYLSTQMTPESVAMIGFSAGGWVTTVAQALDSRIRSGFVVAAPYPLEYRETREAGPEISRIPELEAIASHYDLFVLGTVGDERGRRRQMHIYNQFDRCCWNNRIGTLFEPPVEEVAKDLGGQFVVKVRQVVLMQGLDHTI